MSLKLRKKNHFNLGLNQDVGRIYLRRTFTNILLTLTDLDNKVIVCKTSGNLVLRVLNDVKRCHKLWRLLLNL